MLTLLLVTTLTALDPAPNATVANLQATYRNAGDMSAAFKQIYIDKLRGKKRAEQGKLWVKTDGRVRWTYQEPERKDFVFDGKTAYFYEPENAQVTIFERFQDSPLANAMHFLWGQGDLAKTFDLSACEGVCPSAAVGDGLVQLVPKKPMPAVDHIVLVVDGKTHKVRESVVFDPLGNRTEYHFSDVQFGAKVETAKFAFTVPPGVSVLRATAEGVNNPTPMGGGGGSGTTGGSTGGSTGVTSRAAP
jgi:outer membrane lipoprotein carrier protein